jgi:hypothetical protein
MVNHLSSFYLIYIHFVVLLKYLAIGYNVSIIGLEFLLG